VSDTTAPTKNESLPELPSVQRCRHVGGSYPMRDDPNGEYVDYDDHVAIMQVYGQQCYDAALTREAPTEGGCGACGDACADRPNGCEVAEHSPPTQPPHHDRGEEVPPMEDDPERPDGPGLPEARGELTKAALAWGRDVSNYALARKMTIATGALEIAAYNAGFAAALTEAKQQGPGEAKPVGSLYVRRWRGIDAMTNHEFDYYGDLPDGSYLVYTAPQVEAKRQTGEGLFYIQDTRQFVGNCPVWWGQDGNGYVTRLDEAGRYTYEKAVRQNRARETDVPWPCDEIDALGRITIDHQHMRPRAERLAEIVAAAKPSGEVSGG